MSFDVLNDTIRRAFEEHGGGQDVSYNRWKAPGFIKVESTIRLVRLVLREGVPLDRPPHLLRFGSGTSLVVLPRLAPFSLRCIRSGHIRRDCRAPRCAECYAFGDEEADCVRSCARAAGRGTANDQNELLMNQEEVEKASTSSVLATKEPGQEDKSCPI